MNKEDLEFKEEQIKNPYEYGRKKTNDLGLFITLIVCCVITLGAIGYFGTNLLLGNTKKDVYIAPDVESDGDSEKTIDVSGIVKSDEEVKVTVTPTEEAKKVTPTPTPTQKKYADERIFYADVDEYLTLRETASTSGKELQRLDPFTAMHILQYTDGKMALVEVVETKATGYVNTEYITSDPNNFALAGKSKSNSNSSTVQDNNTYTVRANEYITLRQSPSTSAGAITTLSSGASVKVLETPDSEFWKVEANGQVGYVMRCYLGISGIHVNGTYTVSADEYLTLRDIPDTTGNEITKLNAGTTVSLLELTNETFCKVSANGQVGYVMTCYLK